MPTTTISIKDKHYIPIGCKKEFSHAAVYGGAEHPDVSQQTLDTYVSASSWIKEMEHWQVATWVEKLTQDYHEDGLLVLHKASTEWYDAGGNCGRQQRSCRLIVGYAIPFRSSSRP